MHDISSRTRQGNKVPIDLLRLRSATVAYMAILNDEVMFLEAFAEANKPSDPTADDWPGILLRRVKAAMTDSETPGTVSGIAYALAVLLGEA
jgi:hypothetical protein